jgi:hypothetical protein
MAPITPWQTNIWNNTTDSGFGDNWIFSSLHVDVNPLTVSKDHAGALRAVLAGLKQVEIEGRILGELTDHGTKDGRQDAENQLIALREYCIKQGREITGEYVDHESAGTSKRQHFQRLFADASRREFDLVLFWSLDRFSREGVLATLQHLEKRTAPGVNWRSFTEEYLDSCGLFRDAVLSILATIAKQRPNAPRRQFPNSGVRELSITWDARGSPSIGRKPNAFTPRVTRCAASPKS